MAPVVENLPSNARDTRNISSIPELGRSPGVGNGKPLQYSCLENSMDRGAWWDIVDGVAKSQTRLSTHAHTHVHTQFVKIRLDQISRSVVSDSLRPHESQHTRPPCPSPTPGLHSESRPSSQ